MIATYYTFIMLHQTCQVTPRSHTHFRSFSSLLHGTHIFCEPLVNRGQVLVVLHFLLLLTSHAAFISVINICVCTL